MMETQIKPDNVKIEVFPKDSSDGRYCAIVMLYRKQWYNSGLAVREATAAEAFDAAKKLAITAKYWK